MASQKGQNCGRFQSESTPKTSQKLSQRKPATDAEGVSGSKVPQFQVQRPAHDTPSLNLKERRLILLGGLSLHLKDETIKKFWQIVFYQI